MSRGFLFFSLVLFSLIFANLGYLLGLSPWLGLAPPLLLVPSWLLLRRTADGAGRVRLALVLCNQLSLLLVALALAGQAWFVLAETGVSVRIGPLLPLFVAALALYLLHVSLSRLRARDVPGMPHFLQLLTGPALLPTVCTGLILTAFALVLLDWLQTDLGILQSVSVRFLERGLIPPLTLLLFFCGLLILVSKWGANWYLYQVLAGRLGTETAMRIAATIAALGSPRREILEDQLQLIRYRSEESYLIPRYISWAVPILGFIGTVLGISLAADGIRRIVSSQEGLTGLSSDLGQAIAPLGIAFDTTLIALSLSVVLTLILTLVQRGEERVLSGLEERLRGASSGTSH